MAGTRFIEELNSREFKEIEQRMRDRRFSRAGFLGPHESLRDVIEDDARVLRALGVSHEQIERRIVEICKEGCRCHDARPSRTGGDTLDPVRSRSWMDCEVRRRQAAHRPLGTRDWGLSMELDAFRLLLERTHPLLLPSGFGFALVAWMGLQHCPFRDPAAERSCGATDSDFLILNPRRQEWIVFSGLLPHLIGAHHFFEGHGTVYRLDPELTIRVLELGARESDRGAAAGRTAPDSLQTD